MSQRSVLKKLTRAEIKFGVDVWNCTQSALSAGEDGVVDGEEGSTAGEELIVKVSPHGGGKGKEVLWEHRLEGFTASALANVRSTDGEPKKLIGGGCKPPAGFTIG